MPLGLIFIDMNNNLREFVNEVLSDFRDELTSQYRTRSFSAGLEHSPLNKAEMTYRREIKQLWNLHADHSFFENPQQFTVVHELGKFSTGDRLNDYFDIAAIGNNPGIDKPARNELSCYAYVGNTHKTRSHVRHFTFKQKRVTFVSFVDAGTEWLSKARNSDKEFYKSSGLPKRPQFSPEKLNFIPLNKEDFIAKPRFHMKSEETVIAHWIVDTYYGHPDEQELAERLGLKFERF